MDPNTDPLIKYANSQQVASNYAPINSPASIAYSSLTSTETPAKLPTEPQEPDYSSSLASVPTFAQIADETIGKDSGAQQTQAGFGERILAALQKMGGQQQAQATAETNAGLPALNTQLVGVNNQIQALQKEGLALATYSPEHDPTLEGRGITKSGMLPYNREHAEKIRLNTVQSLGLSAIAQTLQGNIALAKQQADKAVEVEFAPVQAQLDYLTKAYELNKDALNREDSIRGQLFQAGLQERQRSLDAAKQDRQTIVQMALVAAKNHPNDARAQYAAQQALQAGTLEQAFALVGQYQNDPAKLAQDLADLQYKRSQTALNYSHLAKTDAEAKELSGQNGIKAETYNERQNAINLVNTILADPMLPRAVGGGVLNPLTYIPGSGVQSVRNQLKQLTAVLSLENRAKLKGSGAVSDFESRTLQQASSAFSTTLSDNDATRQLKQIRGVLTTMNGGQADIVARNPATGESGNARADTAAINKMISDGLVVEYQ